MNCRTPLLFVTLIITLSIGATLPGISEVQDGNKLRKSIDKLKINKHGEILTRNPKSQKPLFPDKIEYTLELPDGDRIDLNARRVDRVQSEINLKTWKGKDKVFNFRDKEFYIDDDRTVGGVYMLAAETSSDGTLRSKFKGTFHKDGKKCITSDEKLTCIQADDTLVSNYMNDTRKVPVPVSDDQNNLTSKLHTDRNRLKRTVETIDVYNTTSILELVLILDQVWMQVFRDRNTNEEDAESEAVVYLMCLVVELNLWYRSIGEISRSYSSISDHEIVAYLAGAFIPQPGTDWSFVQDWLFSDGGWRVTRNNCYAPYSCDGLTAFRRWLRDNDLGVSYDHVAMISGRNLYSGYSKSLIGIAYTGTICNSYDSYKISIIEDLTSNIDAIGTLVHEIGHAFNAGHDGVDNDCQTDVNIMASSNVYPSWYNTHDYRTFSVCSVREMADFLDYYGSCLQEHPADTAEKFRDMMCKGGRGQTFGVNSQCDEFLSSSTACTSDVITRMDNETIVSERACWDNDIVACTDSDGQCSDFTLYMITEGTPCGSSATDFKFCYRGECLDEVNICPVSDTTTTSTTTSTTSTTTNTTPTTSTSPTTTTSTTNTTPTTTTSTTNTTPTTSTTPPTTPSTTTPTTTTTTTPPPTTTSAPGCSCVDNTSPYSCCNNNSYNGGCCDGCELQFRFWGYIYCRPILD